MSAGFRPWEKPACFGCCLAAAIREVAVRKGHSRMMGTGCADHEELAQERHEVGVDASDGPDAEPLRHPRR
jgi:hypothetical protein